MNVPAPWIPKNVHEETGKVITPATSWYHIDDALDEVTSSEIAHERFTADDFLEPSIFTASENSWQRKMILSLDGGGIRGYTSLLLLEELMKKVGMLERAADANAVSSAYSPCVDSRVDDEKQQGYKPCHYFDYIGGTSTGGLIAIMLGRFRMTIEATMQEYKKLSAGVFKMPSSWLKRSLGVHASSNRKESLRKIFASLTPEQPSPDEVGEEFRSDPLRCKTIVCTFKSNQQERFKEPFLFRSYDHGSRSCSPYERNPGKASTRDIQTVDSATSAASSYFKSFEVRKSRYYDGAIDLNNPSWEMYNEVNLLTGKGQNSINLFLSVGGGSCKSNKSRDIFRDKRLQRDFNEISEHIDKNLSDESERQNFSYYRLDVDQGLQDVHLNEWKPKRTGEITLRRIMGAFSIYLQAEKNQIKIHDCAQELVRIRTLRAQTMRWEIFATGIRYSCPISNCTFQRVCFETRNELLDHLQIVHDKPPPDVEHYREIQRLLDAGRSNSNCNRV